MHRLTHTVLWVAGIATCVIAVEVSHALKWGAKRDGFRTLTKMTADIRPLLHQDSILYVRALHLPEALYPYLRYALIPQKIAVADTGLLGQMELLIAPTPRHHAAVRALLAAQPEITVIKEKEDDGIGYYLLRH